MPRLVQEDVEDVRREIKVMHHLSGHPHVVAFKGAYEDSHAVHIVMELCTGEPAAWHANSSSSPTQPHRAHASPPFGVRW